MRWAAVIIFAILAVLFGIWAFSAGVSAGMVAVKVVFWVMVVLFFLSLFGVWSRRPAP